MECPISEDIQRELELKLETIDYKCWYHNGTFFNYGHQFSIHLYLTRNRRGELIGEFQHLGYTATRCGLPHIIKVMAQMSYAPAVIYLRKQIINEILTDLE